MKPFWCPKKDDNDNGDRVVLHEHYEDSVDAPPSGNNIDIFLTYKTQRDEEI